jgi:hypothetical protein
MFFKKHRGALWVCIWNQGGHCGCVYGTKGAVDRKSLGTAALNHSGYLTHRHVRNKTMFL